MYIKEVQLDGFKSYAKHTIVGPFDRHFNAITGLNGTGKSNILDAICFLLGVSSLAKVRANRLEDLISKVQLSGQNPVKSAKVSIIFDNTDKNYGSCPLGYEDFENIVISRTIQYKKGDEEVNSQYHLNGKLTQKHVVMSLFESIRVDINTANFIIMQGRITKVVGMRPKELLNMIEETVGAVAYQNKRNLTEKRIKDCERDMAVLETRKEETILPALEIQKDAVKTLKEFEHLEVVVAAKQGDYVKEEYHYCRFSLDKAERDLNAVKDAQLKYEDRKRAEEQAILDLKQRQERLKADAEKQIDMKKVQEDIKKLERNRQVEQREIDAFRKEVKKAHTAVTQLQKEYENEVHLVEDYKNKQKSLLDAVGKINDALKLAEDKVHEFETKEQMVLSGNILDEDGNVINVNEQIIELQEQILNLEGPNSIRKTELKKIIATIRQKKIEVDNAHTDKQIETELLIARRMYNDLLTRLNERGIDPLNESAVETSVQKAKLRLNKIDQELHKIYRYNESLRFYYEYPTPDFDSRSIYGPVYQLVEVCDIEENAIALEVACRSHFQKVLVDRPETSKLLIDNGNLARRTTFLPLSKAVGYHSIPSQEFLDRKLGAGNAVCALSLLRFDSKYRVAMEQFFGTVIVCNDTSVAKKCAFELRFNAVTKDGDFYQPGGFVQGGTRTGAGQYLKACHAVRALLSEKNKLDHDCRMWLENLDVYKRHAQDIQAFTKAKKELEAKEALLSLTTKATLEADLEILEGKRDALLKELDTANKEIGKLKEKERSLLQKQRSQKEMQERSKSEIQAQLKLWREKLKVAKQRKNAKDTQYQDIEDDFKAKESFLRKLQQEIAEAKSSATEKSKELEGKETEFNASVAKYDADYSVLMAKIDQFNQMEADIQSVEKQIADRDTIMHKLELQIMKHQPKLKEATRLHQFRKDKVAQLVQAHPQLVNLAPAEPPSKSRLDELKSTLDRYKERLNDIRLRINRKAAAALPETEKRIKEQDQFMKIIKSNKEKLGSIIAVLDSRKANLVEAAYNRINKEFDSMMTMLLPGAHAQLRPVNQLSLDDGVAIHVQLGGVWKESLSELSGGQRSLVALALVLAMCMYNPAPFYILDEIDSALDLNHTANIGYLIRSKFQNVQFICVSLKDGMYKNANVLFSTEFRNGTSHVKRSAKAQMSSS